MAPRTDNSPASDDTLTSGDAWASYHAVVLLVASFAVVLANGTLPLLLAIPVSFGYLVHRDRHFLLSAKPGGGLANQLTLLRLLIICVAAYGIGRFDWTLMLALFSTNVALDILDGYVARRSGQTTLFGAALDREVDAAFVLVAYLYFYLEEGVAVWILLPGLLPYIYRSVAWMAGGLSMAETRQSHAVALAGINFGLLLIAIAMPANYQLAVLIISTSIVVLSFAISFRDLYRYCRADQVF